MAEDTKKPQPTWHMKVTSSNIDEVWYRPATKQLRVLFSNGGAYQYSEVTPEEFHDFSISSSQGKYFHDMIRSEKPFKKVE